MDFPGVTREGCEYAFREFVMPMIVSTSGKELIEKCAGCVVVLDPNIPYEPKYRHAIVDPRLFSELELWEYSFGDEEAYDIAKYERIARAKAFTSFLTGRPSLEVQQVMPVLYAPGMTKLGGSAVLGDGPMRLIVAFSGVEWFFDQMISEMMISALKACSIERMVDAMEDNEDMIPARSDPDA